MKRLAALIMAAIIIGPLLASVPAKTQNDNPFAPPLPLILSRPRANERSWWEITSMDKDRNGIFDNLENKMERNPLGTYDVFIDFDRAPTEKDIELIERLGIEITNIFESINCVGARAVPKSLVPSILELDGVVMIEGKGMPTPRSDIATPAVKARESGEYSPYTAWELNYTGKGATVCIMDTGIDNAHPGLAGKWVGGADFTKPNTPLHPRDGSFDADDTNGHGTTCAGIATGTGAPEGQYMGAAPDARLVDLRIGTIVGASPGEGPIRNYDAAIEATEWAVQHAHDQWSGVDPEYHGIDVLSLSWGIPWEGSTDGSDAYSRALNALEEAGTVVVVAAGNDGPDNEGFTGMGSADKVITVGATDDKDTIKRKDDGIASYSSRGPRDDDGDDYPYDELKPDVSSPGTGITQCEYSPNPLDDASGNGYGPRGSGTSYATPNIAGIVALVIEANENLTPVVYKEIIRASAEPWDEPTYPELDPFWNRDFGWGVADAYRAVRMAEMLGNDSAVDVELQCHIMNHTVTSDESAIKLAGISWSRAGEVELVEVRVGEGEWVKVDGLTLDAGENNTFAQWTIDLSLEGLDAGNHTVEARAVSNNMTSLHDFVEISLKEPPLKKAAAPSGMNPAILFLAVLILGVAGWVAYKKGLIKGRKVTEVKPLDEKKPKEAKTEKAKG